MTYTQPKSGIFKMVVRDTKGKKVGEFVSQIMVAHGVQHAAPRGCNVYRGSQCPRPIVVVDKFHYSVSAAAVTKSPPTSFGASFWLWSGYCLDPLLSAISESGSPVFDVVRNKI